MTRPAEPEDLEYVARDLEQMGEPNMARKVRACMDKWLDERDGSRSFSNPVSQVTQPSVSAEQMALPLDLPGGDSDAA